LSGKRVLDIGCGSGPYVAEALRRGAAHVTGVDPAPRMLELARERVARLGQSDRLSLVEGYFPDTDLAGSFDGAIVMGVLDYVGDPAAFLRRLATTVMHGAALSFPSEHWFRTPLRKVRYRLRRCPVWFYTERRIAEIMRAAGVARYDVRKIDGAGLDYFVTMRSG
ncbi:MAG: class I SAM-dependent methyltransferase, partial [Candidatus Rokuibacteriota bacterium]